MSIKKMIATTLIVATIATPALARVDISVGFAPPPEQVEYVPPPPQPSVVWIPGYWAWRHGHYVWVAGRYVAERPGYFWVADEWVQFNGGWRRAPGHWERQHFPDHNAEWHGPIEAEHHDDAWRGAHGYYR